MSTELNESILSYLDNYLDPWQFYEILQLKSEYVLNLIAYIMKESGKTVPEAVLVFIAVIKSQWDGASPLLEFIKENTDSICKKVIAEKAQGNLPGRALPLLDIFSKRMAGHSISIIELGASFGLIGRCLLNSRKIVENNHLYFPSGQQLPQNPEAVHLNQYIGIELKPPCKEWVLAWEWLPVRKKRLEKFLEDIPTTKQFQLLQENAFGFSSLQPVKDLQECVTHIVILTSFMLYQFPPLKQNQLGQEIKNFIHKVRGNWINQTFDPITMKCFIEMDEERIIELSDDGCRSWHWLT